MSTRHLHISEDDKLILPPDAVTQTFVVYGMKGQGKTVLGAVLAEELYYAKHKFSYLDPIGPGYGLRYGADGKSAGLDILVLGGKHGDLPIESTGGAVVADLVVNESISTVIDISRRADGTMWSKGEKIRFVGDYFTRLYARQGEKSYPMMQIVDEAGRFIPEQIPHGAVDIAKCVGAIEEWTELGRNIGGGVCLITQRSARMKKSVSELAECMIAFRTVGPNSIGAIVDWLGEHVPRDRHKEMVGELRKLPRGSALVVSPGWLEFEGIVKMRMRHTFDASATPRADRKIVTPRQLTKPDLERYRTAIAETIERAKDNDPTALRAEVSKLRKEIARLEKRPAAAAPAKPQIVPMVKPEWIEEVAHLAAVARDISARISKDAAQRLERLSYELERAAKQKGASHPGTNPQPTIASERGESVRRQHVPRPEVRPVPRVERPEGSNAHDAGDSGRPLSKAERKILTALAHYPEGRTLRQVSLLAGYALNGGGFRNAVGALRSAQFVTDIGELLKITEPGLLALGPVEALPTGPELLDYWMSHPDVGRAGREILRVLSEHDGSMSLADIAAKTVSERGGPYDPDGGGFRNALGRLRTLQVIEGTGEALQLTEEMQ